MCAQLLVSEYVTGGGWPAGALPAPSLRREGAAMLCAVAADFARVDGCGVVTTWDRRLGAFPQNLPGVRVFPVASPDAERQCVERLAGQCDAAFLIAPEFDGILAARRDFVQAAGGRVLGTTTAGIRLTADKLELAAHLRRHGIATIPTAPFGAGNPDRIPPFPFVVKPRDGAGSLDTFLVDRPERLAEALRAFHQDGQPREQEDPGTGLGGRGVWQPFVAGANLSVAAVVSPGRTDTPRSGLETAHSEARTSAGRIEVFPPAAQHLSHDGRLQYLGGRVPAAGHAAEAIERLVHRVCGCVPGLAGYVGFDLILPEGGDPILVEINPRLTTSYLGYRALAVDNLAERLLFPQREFPPVRWRAGAVEFRVGG